MLITVLGAGAFGTAIAQLLAENGHEIVLWCYEAEVAASINNHRSNQQYLPGVLLSDKIKATTELQEACASPLIFEAVPVAHLRAVLATAHTYLTPQHRFVILSKGIEQDTLLLPSEIINEFFPTASLGVLSGPSYAKEVAAGQQTRVTLAAEDHQYAQEIEKIITNSWFTAERSDDLRGVQFCAAYKNVAAIYLGMLEGAGYGENAQACAFLDAVAEMQQLVILGGGKAETVSSPAGIGDLVLTGFGTLSRNRRFGQLLGAGKSFAESIVEVGTIPEGINSALVLQAWAHKHQRKLSLVKTVYDAVAS